MMQSTQLRCARRYRGSLRYAPDLWKNARTGQWHFDKLNPRIRIPKEGATHTEANSV
jgi:hypothetical protein